MMNRFAADPTFAAAYDAALLGLALPSAIVRAVPGPIQVVDVGALRTNERDVYEPLGQYHSVSVLGFEPQAAATETTSFGKMTRTVLPLALGDGQPVKLHQTCFPAASSTRRPNKAVLSSFHALPEMLEVQAVGTIPTVRLDDVREIADCDLLKIDVQGAELDVLRHGERVLSNATIVIAETEFVPLYEGQPLFADLDIFMRGLGFRFVGFLAVGCNAWRAAPFGDHAGYLTWADAVYVASDERLTELGTDKILKAFLVAHHILRNSGCAAHLLALHDEAAGPALLHHYNSLLHWARDLTTRVTGKP